MKRMACALVLLLPGLGLAQQPSPPLAGTSPNVTQERTSEHLTAPEQAVQSSEQSSTPEVQQFIHDGLSTEPALAGTSVSVKTDDRAIVLMGSVGSEKQHEVA
jgi:osmotically-inducible protein OsmY